MYNNINDNINNNSNINKRNIKNIKSKKPYILEIHNLKNKNNENKNNFSELLTYSKELSPLSGSELNYDPNLWNNTDSIRESHNCYSYAMGKIVKGLESKAQPGYASGFNHVNNNNFTCSSFRKRLKKDVPGSYLETFDKSCLPGFYKVFLALDPGNDYHWWRQDSNGMWSHKPGSTNVVNVDASQKKIKNPLLSNRHFKNRNYKEPCFFACIYSDLSRSIDTIYKKY
jgi:hypothetical protein